MEADNNYGKQRAGGITGVKDPAEALKKFRQPLFEYLVSGLEAEDKRVQLMAAGMLGALGDPVQPGISNRWRWIMMPTCVKSPGIPSRCCTRTACFPVPGGRIPVKDA